MEKTLTIDGRQIKFRHTGGTLMRYRNQFNSELLVDLEGLSEVEQNFGKYAIPKLKTADCFFCSSDCFDVLARMQKSS